MKSLRRHAAFRAAFVLCLGALCAAPTPGDVGGCGQHPDMLDPAAFFAAKQARDCQKCGDCNFHTDYCTEVCSSAYEAPGFPAGCVPLVHDGEVCLDALEAAACSEYEEYTKDQGRLVPTECQFCPEVIPMSRAWVGAATLMACGCAIGSQLIAPHDEYRLYRQTRMAPTLEARLAAGNRYLHVAPTGAYAEEVQKWFRGAERSYLARAHDQLPMLHTYLAALPDGPSAVEVKDRIEELETAGRFAEGRESARNQRVGSLESNLARAATQRQSFVAELTGWISALATVRSFQKPLDELPPDVAARFELKDPTAGCPLDLCEKALTPRFAIPQAAAQLVPREASFAAELSVSGGALMGLRLHGRELFSRVGEALDLRPVSFEDPQSRAEAIGRALSIVGNALGSALAADGCERPAVSPVVLERACDGVHVTVTAAIDPGSDDSIAFGPDAPPASPDAGTAPAPGAAPAAGPKRPKH